MLEFLCYFFPAFISLEMQKGIAETKKSLIIDYGVYVALNNLVAFIFVTLANQGEFNLVYNPYDVSYFLSYFLAALIAAFFMPLILKYIRQNFKLDISVTPRPAKNPKKKKQK